MADPIAHPEKQDVDIEKDDTIGAYSGSFKSLLISTQIALRVHIAVENAFPAPEEFEQLIKETFNELVKKYIAGKGEQRCE